MTKWMLVLQCDWTQQGHSADIMWLSRSNRSTWVYACLYCNVSFYLFSVFPLCLCCRFVSLVTATSALCLFSSGQSFSPVAAAPPPSWLLECHSPVFPGVHARLTKGQHWHGGVKLEVQLALLTTWRAEDSSITKKQTIWAENNACLITEKNGKISSVWKHRRSIHPVFVKLL